MIKPVRKGAHSLEATEKKSAVAIAVKLLVQFNENQHGAGLATALEKENNKTFRILKDINFKL